MWRVGLDLYQLVAGLTIILTLPLPFHFYAPLRCSVSVARVGPRQWVIAYLSQHSEVYGCFFVSRGVSRFVRIAARETVDWLFARIHGHIQLSSLHSRSDDGLGPNLALSRGELTPT